MAVSRVTGDRAEMPGNVCSNCLAFGSECTREPNKFKVCKFIADRWRAALIENLQFLEADAADPRTPWQPVKCTVQLACRDLLMGESRHPGEGSQRSDSAFSVSQSILSEIPGRL